MKIALVHDYIKEYGGAERVLEVLHEMYPDAPVFTSVYLPQFLGPHKERFKNWEIRESWVSRVPFREKLISVLRVLSPLIFKSFDFSQFDVVIVSATGAYMSNAIKIRNPKSEIRKTIHICYCHTPPRYLYGYATAREWKKNPLFRVLGELANHFLRLVDFKSAQNVDYFIANSKEVQSRIKKFYKRESTIIYPPVDISFALRSLRQFGDSSDSNVKQSVNLARAELSKYGSKDASFKSAPHAKAPRANSYFLAGGRLARPKNIDLIVKACQELKVPLKVFGRPFGGYEKDVLSIKYKVSSIEFLGEVTDEEKYELMRGAKAYIFASEDEDFGITPVEAMSVGTPVIAYRSGGVQESVIDPSAGSGQAATGVFFDELTVESLIKAIQQFNNITIDSKDCIRQAEKFSKERFKKEIRKFVESRIKLSS